MVSKMKTVLASLKLIRYIEQFACCRLHCCTAAPWPPPHHRWDTLISDVTRERRFRNKTIPRKTCACK